MMNDHVEYSQDQFDRMTREELREVFLNLEDIKRQSKQNSINADWLMRIVDEIHSNLCPGKSGTWQDRAKQAVAASRKIADEKG